MKPTEIRIYHFPLGSAVEGNLKGYATIELDALFVIQDIRIISVTDTQRTFIAFPSRRKGVRCVNQDCFEKHDPGDSYCPGCGVKQPLMKQDDMKFTCHRDCCYPRTSIAREMVESAILRAHSIALAHPGLNSFIEIESGAQVYVRRNLPEGMHHDGERSIFGASRQVPRGSDQDPTWSTR